MSVTSTGVPSRGSIAPPIDEWIELRPGEFLNPKELFDSIDIAQSGDLRYVPDHTLTGGIVNLLDPWQGYRAGQLVLCFPVELPRQFFSISAYFDTQFSFRQSLQETEKFYPNFLRRFPSFTKFNNGLDFYNQIVIYCHGVGIFCPPLHTLSPSCVYGTWYRQIPQSILDNLLRHDEFIKSALSNSPTGLAACSTPNVASSVADLTISGYEMIRRLLTAFGHPKLSSLDTLSTTAPTQRRDNTLEQYTKLWRIHLHIQTLNHQVYSDRRFLHLFLQGLHPSCKGVFRLHVCPSIAAVPPHHPLPSTLQPSAIYTHLYELCVQLGRPQLTGRPDGTSRQPGLTGPTLPAAVFSLGEGDSTLVDLLPTDPFITLVRAIAALHTSDACFYCNTVGCRTTTCSKFQELLADPQRLDRLQRILSAVQKRQANSTPKAPRFPRHINQTLDLTPLVDATTDDLSVSSETTLVVTHAISADPPLSLVSDPALPVDPSDFRNPRC
jgi:hypothetical protein